MPGKRIIIGTRGSKLALCQTGLMQSLFERFHPDIEIDRKIIKTKGDAVQDAPLAQIGDKGLFTREIEHALLQGEIDLAIHSVKDLPTKLPPGLTLGAIPKREDPRDAFVSYKYKMFSELPRGAVIATSSLRRRANVLINRPDIQLVNIRGNVDTRLRKLKENNYDGMILAAAGLLRLGYNHIINEILDPNQMLPAVSQGAMGVEVREDDQQIMSLLKPLHDPNTSAAVLAERSFLRRLEGGCQVPIGAIGHVENGKCRLQGMISDLDGKLYFKGSLSGSQDQPETIGVQLAENLINKGAQKILDEIHREQRAAK